MVALIFATLSLALAASSSAATFSPQATLTASDEIGKSLLGSAVALDRDGDTALVAGPQDSSGLGAAWVFVRKHGTWAEQAKLTGGGETGSGEFGTSVALSSDGKTALIGAPGDNGGLGAAWVFTRSGRTWRERGSKLTGAGEAGKGSFGQSVALSSDARTALIGAPGDTEGDGAAWAFTRRGSAWKEQGPKLTGAGEVNAEYCCGLYSPRGQFGQAVALSSDGNTALIGGPDDHYEYFVGMVGTVWVFTRSGPTWHGSKLTGEEPTTKAATRRPYTDGAPLGEFGAGVALSPDGNLALVGVRPRSDACVSGEALVFTRSAATWTKQGESLTPFQGPNICGGEETEGRLGYRVALSSDANTALISGERAAWMFTLSGSSWREQVPPFRCAGYECGVALSGDAGTVLVGTTVYVPAPVPVVTHVTPSHGSQHGGTQVTITGSGFTKATAVTFGSTSAASFTVNSDGSITVVSPAGTGTVDVTVTNPTGASLTWEADRFSYVPPPTVGAGQAEYVNSYRTWLTVWVDAKGGTIEECYFEYGTTTSYGYTTPCYPSPPFERETPVAFVDGLRPETTYHFRAVARNETGTTYGPDQTFTTLP